MHELSSKELHVLQQLSTGLQYKEIAVNLDISVNTVKKHLKNIYRKKDLKNRKHAGRYYRNLLIQKDA